MSWPAMAKKSSSLRAALMIRKRYVFPDSTSIANVSTIISCKKCIIRIISLPHEYHYHRLQYFGFNFFMVTYVSRSMEKVGLASH